MAKRMIDTDLFKKGFLKALDLKYKALWVYLLNDCNHAGVWEVELDIAGIRLGADYDERDVLEKFEDKIVVFDGGQKWFIPSFVEFQYGPELSKSNNIFKSIDSILTKYDLYQYLNIEITEVGTTISAFRGRLSQKVKDKVLLNAEFTCQYCSEQKSKAELIVDHFVPLNRGGNNEDWNLVCSCTRCNSHKTDLLPEDFLSRSHAFLRPTEKIQIKLNEHLTTLKGAFKNLEGGKDKDLDKDKEKVKEKEKVKVEGGVGETEKFKSSSQLYQEQLEIAPYINAIKRGWGKFCKEKGLFQPTWGNFDDQNLGSLAKRIVSLCESEGLEPTKELMEDTAFKLLTEITKDPFYRKEVNTKILDSKFNGLMSNIKSKHDTVTKSPFR